MKRLKLRSDQIRSDQKKQSTVELPLDVARLDEGSGLIVGGTATDRLFLYWQLAMEHGGAKLDKKRRRLIQAALKLGYSEAQLQTAIAGCAQSTFHRGHNDRGQRYDQLDLILRDAAHIDQFIAIATKPRASSQGLVQYQDPA